MWWSYNTDQNVLFTPSITCFSNISTENPSKNSKGIELIFVVRNMPLRTISKRILGMLKSQTNNISPLNVQVWGIKKETFWKFLSPILSWPSHQRIIIDQGFQDTQKSVSLLADLHGSLCRGALGMFHVTLPSIPIFVSFQEFSLW